MILLWSSVPVSRRKVFFSLLFLSKIEKDISLNVKILFSIAFLFWILFYLQENGRLRTTIRITGDARSLGPSPAGIEGEAKIFAPSSFDCKLKLQSNEKLGTKGVFLA